MTPWEERRIREVNGDPRYLAMRDQLRKLSPHGLRRIIRYRELLCLDEGNFVDGKRCPLAVGLNLRALTDEEMHAKIKKAGFNPRNLKDINGEFFTTNRLYDLILLVNALLSDKNEGCRYYFHYQRCSGFGGPNFCSRCGKTWKW